jgi:hypothetical protein
MHVHLLVPDLLCPLTLSLPAGELRLPGAERLLARGRRERAGLTMEAWLKARYGLESPGDTGLAACSLLGEGMPPGADAWMRADPVHLKVGMDSMMLADSNLCALEAAEAEALASHLNQHFGDRLSLVAAHPHRWYVRTASLPAISTHALAEVRGDTIRDSLPEGPDSAHWRALMNEVQMALHEHPVNEARESRGQLPVNSLWFWGPGTHQAPEGKPFDLVLADDALARGLAASTGASAAGLPADAASWLDRLQLPVSGRVLIVLESLRPLSAYADAPAWLQEAGRLESAWFAPLLEALRSGRLGMLSLHACTPGWGKSVEVTRLDLQRFWRRVRPLQQHAQSPDDGGSA